MKVIFIGGSGRSGSTIADLLLGQIPGFHSAGEIRLIWNRGFHEDRLCGCGTPFSKCDFWKQVVVRAFGSDAQSVAEEAQKLSRLVDRRVQSHKFFFGRYSNSFAENLARYREILSNLYSAIHYEAGCKVIVDSSKFPNHGFVLAGMPSIDLHVLHLVRDPRAVAFSWMRKRINPDVHWARTYMGQYGPFVSTRGWILSNLMVERLRRRVEKSCRLRYEDLVEDPTRVLESTLISLDILGDKTQDLSSPAWSLSRENHTVAGNPVRLSSGGLTLRLDDEWTRSLSRAAACFVSAAAMPWLMRYSYNVVPTRVSGPESAGNDSR